MTQPKPYNLTATYKYTDRNQQVQRRVYRVNQRVCFFIWDCGLSRWIFLPFDQAIADIERGVLIEQSEQSEKMAGE